MHPKQTVIVPAKQKLLESGITIDTKKVILQASTPNDIKLDFDVIQKKIVSKARLTPSGFDVYPKPNTTIDGEVFGKDTDIAFSIIRSPNFSIIVEKIKVCLHQPSTFGCFRINVWDFKKNEENIPENLVGVDAGEEEKYTSSLIINENTKLISNALEAQDSYMSSTNQTPKVKSLSYTIEPDSIIKFGIQFAQSNAYGLTVFIVGWALECDVNGGEE